MNELREHVRDRYAAAAKVVASGRAADDTSADLIGCCDGYPPEEGSGLVLYDAATRADLPEEARAAASTCCCRRPASAPRERSSAST